MQTKLSQSNKFVLRAVAWTSRRALRKIDDEYFKPRVKKFMEKHNIPKLKSGYWHFQTFEILVENEERITGDLPPKVQTRLV